MSLVTSLPKQSSGLTGRIAAFLFRLWWALAAAILVPILGLVARLMLVVIRD